MRKILIILCLLAGLGASSQPGYTYIAQRYKWLAGLFTALGLPAGPGPAAFESGQAQRAGSVYYDSSGIDAGLYIYDGSTWVAAGGGTTLTEGEGIAVTGDSIHIGGRTAHPSGLFSQNRTVNVNRKGIYWINGTQPNFSEDGGTDWQTVNQPVFSPYQFLSSDTVTGSVDPPTAAVPWSGIYARRTLYYDAVASINTPKTFGHAFDLVHNWQDTFRVNTQLGGNYGVPLSVKAVFEPRGNGSQRMGIVSGVANLIPYYGVPVVLANIVLRNNANGATNTIHTWPWLVGYKAMLVMGTNDTLERASFYQTDDFLGGGNAKARKLYGLDFQHSIANGAGNPDSSFGIWDQYGYNHWLRGNTVIGTNTGTHTWSSSDKFKVIGNATITDSLTLGKATQLGATTGLRILGRRTSDGAVFEVDPSTITGTGQGLDDVLSVGQALTTDRSTPTSAFQWDIASSSTSRTLGLTNTGVGGVGLYVSATNTLSQGIQADGLVYGANITSNNVPLRLNTDRGATANMMELNRTYNAGNGPDGMVGNVYEYNMEDDGGNLEAVNVMQTTLVESGNGNERSTIQIKGKNAGTLEDYLDMQTGGINRTNNNADTLATRAYARSVTGAATTLSKGFMYDTLTIGASSTQIPRFISLESFTGYATSSSGSSRFGELVTGSGAEGRIANGNSGIAGITGFGYGEIATGTTTTGRGAMSAIPLVNANSGGKVDNAYYYRVLYENVIVNDLSDGTDTYVLTIGFKVDNANTNALVFTYTHSVNSGAWVCTSYNNVTPETTNTGSTVNADTEYDLGIELYNQTVKFYINGTLVATHSTQVPAAASAMQEPYFGILKSAGSNNRQVFVDNVFLRYTHENDL